MTLFKRTSILQRISRFQNQPSGALLRVLEVISIPIITQALHNLLLPNGKLID